MTLTLVLLVKIPPDGIASFNEYEDLVLPLVKNHSGRIQQRMRTLDQTTELHILSFESQSGFDNFLADPRRERHRHLLQNSKAISELFKMEHVS